jgi:CRISPR-associated exonuclease Cas4
MPYFILAFLLFGLGLLWMARRRLSEAGLPPGRVVYIDMERFGRLERSLYDPRTDLSGRPDYLVDIGDGIVPVEVKSGRAPFQPYRSHVLQLAAYCFLVHAELGKRPRYGVLRYGDKAFAVDYTSEIENELLDVLAEMKRSESQIPDRSHESFNRCNACGVRQHCDQVLK